MTDREKAIKGLECCGETMNCNECPYDSEMGGCFRNLKADALKLLKEQEPVKPILAYIGKYTAINGYRCPVCNTDLYHLQKYCNECGRAVKWE